MKTKFYSDLNIEQPFYQEWILQLKGKRYKPKQINGQDAYRVTCPACKHHIALMGVANNRKTFILLCPNPKCECRKGINLHQLITTYGTSQDREKWWDARNQPVWLPIKNRRVFEKNKPLTFKEKMDKKSYTFFNSARIKIKQRTV